MPQDSNDEPASELLEHIAGDAPPANRCLGMRAAKLRVFVNFDDPLPDDILTEFEGR